jgi:hypothetical protein
MITDPNLTSARSRLRSVLCLLLFVAPGVAVAGAIGSSRAGGEREHSARFDRHSAGQASKMAPWVIEHTANGQQAEFFVVLADQADLRRGNSFSD